jgi:hypothetical protein
VDFFKTLSRLGVFPRRASRCLSKQNGPNYYILKAGEQEWLNKSINVTGQSHNSKLTLEIGEPWMKLIYWNSGVEFDVNFYLLLFSQRSGCQSCSHISSSFSLGKWNLPCLTAQMFTADLWSQIISYNCTSSRLNSNPLYSLRSWFRKHNSSLANLL